MTFFAKIYAGFIWFVICLVLSSDAWGQDGASTLDLDQDWQYRWGVERLL